MACLTFSTELRPCYVKKYTRDPKRPYAITMTGEDKALFHRWINKSEIVPPSNLKGGHNGGTVSGTLGLVELENGQVCEVNPSDIRFVDNEIKNYCFPDPAKEEISKEIDAAYLDLL